ncbi:MAG: UDPGP type 1 family protein [Myxococcota bacterium]
MPSPTDFTYKAIHHRYQALGQAHVFQFWNELGEGQRQELLAQAARLEPRLGDLLRAVPKRPGSQPAPDREGLAEEVRPLQGAITLPRHGGDAAAFQGARERGAAVLKAGRVAALVVAGGQGTRLRFDGPKGHYPLGPVTDRTLFALQAQKLRGLHERWGRIVPWYVMTSPATDSVTREHFEAEDFFELDPADVRIFCQGMAPAVGFDGRLLLESPAKIVENPNGHGGVLTALDESGALDDMERRGIDLIFYYQVDNPLVQIGDPAYLGFHEQEKAEMSCKVVRKQDPMAKVGVVAEVDGRVAMLEYTELPDSFRDARDDANELVYWAGNTAMHLLQTSFVRRIARKASAHLPYHASPKSIPYVDDTGQRHRPATANGYKLERFVFDALPAARRTCVVEADPAREFSPIKNAEGSESPETARRDLVAQYRLWMEAAGLPTPSSNRLVEIDHAYIDNLDDARALACRPEDDLAGRIRFGPEVHG